MKTLFIITIFSILVCFFSYVLGETTMTKPIRLSQALRQIRGFRPTLLSTARGFGKRTSSLFNNAVLDYT